MKDQTNNTNVVPITSVQLLNFKEIENRINTLLTVFHENAENLLEDNVIRGWLGKLDYSQVSQSDINKLASILTGKLIHTGMNYKDIGKRLKDSLHQDVLWAGISCYVGEDNGRMYIEKTSAKGRVTKEYISNFILVPSYTLEVNNKDITQTYYVFDLLVTSRVGKKYTVKLTSSDFNSLKDFQMRLKEQAEHSGSSIFDAYGHMRGIHHRYVTLGAEHVSRVKTGTSVLGYERLTDDGEKYFCSTNGNVYNTEGAISDSLMYIGADLPSSDRVLLSSLTNLDYDLEKWKKVIAPTLIRESIKLHTKDNMLLVIGWMAGLPHEYNARKVTQAYPLLHVAGQQGAGKSTIIQALKPFMGYRSDSIDNFPSPPAMTKSATLGYTIPLVYDEYGGSEGANGWSQARYNETHLVMKDIYSKALKTKLGRGEGGQGSFSYKMRSSMISLGQSFLTDPSIATRSVQVYVYSAFHQTEEGAQAKEAAQVLRDMEDKNFWTGYNIWCMNQPDQEVEDTIRDYASYTSGLDRKGSRQKNVAATVMTGLYYWRKMARELGLNEEEIGFSEEDILRIPEIMSDIIDTANGSDEDTNMLMEYLRDIGNDSHSTGNTYGSKMYGKGYSVCSHTPTSDKEDPGKYGGRSKEACIYGQDLILIDVEAMCNYLNKKHGTTKYTLKDLNVYLQSAFQSAKLNNGNGLVLAPNGYNVKINQMIKKYTVFNKELLLKEVPEFGSIPD